MTRRFKGTRAVLVAVVISSSVVLGGDTGQLSVFPEKAVLYGQGARQHVLVTWKDSHGAAQDVTMKARLVINDAAIAQAEVGSIRAIGPGTTRLNVSYAGISTGIDVDVRPGDGSRELSFVKDVVPIFTKFGCAGSNCHGSVRGKAGFKLSLFGYEPDLDYDAILKASDGRRVNRANPETSLILRKPTSQVPHGGGKRFEDGSLPYNAILEWLRSGAKYDSVGSPRLASLSVFPAERWIIGLQQTQQLVAMGRYTDGSLEDMTDKVQFTSNDESVVEVSRGGLVKALAPGESTIMVRSLGQAVAARVFVVTSAAGVDYPVVPANNYIDRYVFEKLRRTNVVPSDVASDEHFLRRIYLDVLGILALR